jgi:hypothetical protein
MQAYASDAVTSYNLIEEMAEEGLQTGPANLEYTSEPWILVKQPAAS